MPMSSEFENRLYPILDQIVPRFETPFHIYDGTVELIRRAETVDDYFATLNFEPQIMPDGVGPHFADLKN